MAWFHPTRRIVTPVASLLAAARWAVETCQPATLADIVAAANDFARRDSGYAWVSWSEDQVELGLRRGLSGSCPRGDDGRYRYVPESLSENDLAVGLLGARRERMTTREIERSLARLGRRESLDLAALKRDSRVRYADLENEALWWGSELVIANEAAAFLMMREGEAMPVATLKEELSKLTAIPMASLIIDAKHDDRFSPQGSQIALVEGLEFRDDAGLNSSRLLVEHLKSLVALSSPRLPAVDEGEIPQAFVTWLVSRIREADEPIDVGELLGLIPESQSGDREPLQASLVIRLASEQRLRTLGEWAWAASSLVPRLRRVDLDDQEQLTRLWGSVAPEIASPAVRDGVVGPRLTAQVQLRPIDVCTGSLAVRSDTLMPGEVSPASLEVIIPGGELHLCWLDRTQDRIFGLAPVFAKADLDVGDQVLLENGHRRSMYTMQARTAAGHTRIPRSSIPTSLSRTSAGEMSSDQVATVLSHFPDGLRVGQLLGLLYEIAGMGSSEALQVLSEMGIDVGTGSTIVKSPPPQDSPVLKNDDSIEEALAYDGPVSIPQEASSRQPIGDPIDAAANRDLLVEEENPGSMDPLAPTPESREEPAAVLGHSEIGGIDGIANLDLQPGDGNSDAEIDDLDLEAEEEPSALEALVRDIWSTQVDSHSTQNQLAKERDGADVKERNDICWRLAWGSSRMALMLGRRHYSEDPGYQPAVELADLVIAGLMGLHRASDTWDPYSGKYSTFGWYWCAQVMRRVQADEGRLIRLPVHAHDVWLKGRIKQEASWDSDGHGLSHQELAKALEISELALWQYERAGTVTTGLEDLLCLAASRVEENHDDEPLDDCLSVEPRAIWSSDPADAAHRMWEKETARRCLDLLPKRERLVLQMRKEKGQTLQEVGDAIGLTRERARQIENHALERIRDAWHRGAGGLEPMDLPDWTPEGTPPESLEALYEWLHGAATDPAERPYVFARIPGCGYQILDADGSMLLVPHKEIERRWRGIRADSWRPGAFRSTGVVDALLMKSLPSSSHQQDDDGHTVDATIGSDSTLV